jgi:hypothetical protein
MTRTFACAATALLAVACSGPSLENGEGDDEGSASGAIYAGYWSGSVGGEQLVFHVDEQGVLDSLIATLRIELGQGDACVGNFYATETADVASGRFDVPLRYAGGPVSTRLSGSFASEASVLGSVDSLRGSSISLRCGSSYIAVSSSASWTIISGATWSASPGAVSCRWLNDGECDERAGTGLCLEGTDSADCG